MSSPPCLTGPVGKIYRFELEIFKSPTTSSTLTSQTSSPSSTLSSENSTNNNNNSQLHGLVSTRKTRTPRKRPNQTYNEAAALLSTVYPKLFPEKQHVGINPPRNCFTKRHDEYSEDLFYGSASLKPQIVQSRFGNSIWDGICPSPGEVDSRILDSNSAMELDGGDDFDSESIILDEGIENGIDSIMGNIGEGSNGSASSSSSYSSWNNPLELGVGMKMGGLRAMRGYVNNGNWWCSPTVEVLQISHRLVNKPTAPPPQILEVEKKKKVEVDPPKKAAAQLPEKENPTPKVNFGLILKLNYEGVVNAWSDRPSPFSDEISCSDQSGNDVSSRLAQIDLFSDGGLREASVMRYKEKRRTRLFSKKIRYQVRKVNADQRPRMKGRFVRRPNSSTNGQKSKEEE